VLLFAVPPTLEIVPVVVKEVSELEMSLDGGVSPLLPDSAAWAVEEADSTAALAISWSEFSVDKSVGFSVFSPFMRVSPAILLDGIPSPLASDAPVFTENE